MRAIAIAGVVFPTLTCAARTSQINAETITRGREGNLLEGYHTDNEQFVPPHIVPFTPAFPISPIVSFPRIRHNHPTPSLRHVRVSSTDGARQADDPELSGFRDLWRKITKTLGVADSDDDSRSRTEKKVRKNATKETNIIFMLHEQDGVPDTERTIVVDQRTVAALAAHKQQLSQAVNVTLDAYKSSGNSDHLVQALKDSLGAYESLYQDVLITTEVIDRLTRGHNETFEALKASWEAYASLELEALKLRSELTVANVEKTDLYNMLVASLRGIESMERANLDSKSMIDTLTREKNNLAQRLQEMVKNSETLKEAPSVSKGDLDALVAERDDLVKAQASLGQQYKESLDVYESLKQKSLESEGKVVTLTAERDELVQTLQYVKEAYADSVDTIESLQQKSFGLESQLASLKETLLTLDSQKEALYRAHSYLKSAFQASKTGFEDVVQVSKQLMAEKEVLLEALRQQADRTFREEMNTAMETDSDAYGQAPSNRTLVESMDGRLDT